MHLASDVLSEKSIAIQPVLNMLITEKCRMQKKYLWRLQRTLLSISKVLDIILRPKKVVVKDYVFCKYDSGIYPLNEIGLLRPIFISQITIFL